MLTLPDNNQLTGANASFSIIGGTVAVNGSNDYTGVTTVGGSYINPSQAMGEAGAARPGHAPRRSRQLNTVRQQPLPTAAPTAASAVGQCRVQPGAQWAARSSTPAPAASSDRLFTIQPNGATLDASGTGPVNFTNAGAIVSADAAAGRTATIDSRIRVLYLTTFRI